MEIIGTMTSKGQITIPRNIRKALGLHPGDHVTFQVNEECIMLRKNIENPSFAGLLRQYGKNVTLNDEDVQQAILRGTGEEEA